MEVYGHESIRHKPIIYPATAAECEVERDCLYHERWEFQRRIGLRAMYTNPELKAQSDDMLRSTHLLTQAIARRNKTRAQLRGWQTAITKYCTKVQVERTF